MQDLLILMVVVWTAGRCFRQLGLPTVFGEVLGGILVGPAVLNLVDGNTETVRVLSELGVFFLMFHTGLKTDHRELLSVRSGAILIALSGIAFSMIGGYAVGSIFGLDKASALFLGMGLSACAIPIVVRVLKDLGLEHSRLGHLTLGSGVVSDIAVLIIFSLVMRYAENGGLHLSDLLITFLTIAIFFAGVVWIGLKTAPVLHRYLSRGRKAFTLTLIVALLFGVLAEIIGLHSMIGAFLAGLFMQEELIDANVYGKIEDRFYALAYSFFGPIFFATLAFHISFSAIGAAPLFLTLTLIASFAGKLIGSGGMSLLLKLPVRESLFVGLSMNIRGTVELIVAAIGLERGIINETVFSILVITAFASTLISMLWINPLAKRMHQAGKQT